MSTQIQLHERTEEMTDEILRSEGHMGGGPMGSLMGQLNSSKDYFEELNNLLHEADSIVVGNDIRDDGPQDVADLFDGPTEVTERKIKQVSATIANSEDVSPEVLEWLETHEGGEVLVIHW